MLCTPGLFLSFSELMTEATSLVVKNVTELLFELWRNVVQETLNLIQIGKDFRFFWNSGPESAT